MSFTILSLATVTEMCSVAVCCEGRVLANDQRLLGTKHAEELLPMISGVMKLSGCEFGDLDGIAVAKGPGSFTGIRIGIAAARGLALAASKPLLGVNSLEALAHGICSNGRPTLAALDAKRGLVYVQIFAPSGSPLSEARVIKPPDVVGLLSEHQYTVGGTGLGLIRPYLLNSGLKELDLVFDETEGLPRATDIALWANGQLSTFLAPEEVVPIYLRPADVSPSA
jgi:tRNA threonylcarbamoyladenosine biosynthesis protein TsaB